MSEADEHGPGGLYESGPNTEHDRPDDPPKQPSIEEFRKVIRTVTDDMKRIVEHPEIFDHWEPAQLSWYKEHLEHLMDETKRLQKDIEKVIEESKE